MNFDQFLDAVPSLVSLPASGDLSHLDSNKMVLISTMERFLFLTAFAILPTICASATVYYVDGSNGNDLNRGDSIQNAFASIKACVDALNGPGDECHIRAGRYHQPVFQDRAEQRLRMC